VQTSAGLVVGSLTSWPNAPARATTLRGAKTCILVYLLGGPPHLDMWDLKPDAPEGIRGPFQAIPTSVPGVSICEYLPKLAHLADRFTLLRSVSHHNHNHTPMIYYSLTGRLVEQPGVDNDVRPPQRSDHPHIGAVLARLKASRNDLPGYVAIPEVAVRSSISGEFKRGRVPLRGGGAGFLGALFDPLIIEPAPGPPPPIGLPEGLSAARLEQRAALMSLLDQANARRLPSGSLAALRDRAVAITGRNTGAASAFAVDDLPPAERERYGAHRFGRALLLARRLAEAEIPMVSIHWNEMTVCDGWDTHAKNFEALREELLPMLDQGLSALLDDLEERGLLEQTLVAVFGEFGRTPRINKDAGRDHWGSCQSVLLAGGGIRGGIVFGSSDRIGAYPRSEPVDPIDVHATILHCMGIGPSSEIRDQLGRPYAVSTGRVLHEIL
jgi:hypothetical protein